MADISSINLPNGTTYTVKDSTARNHISNKNNPHGVTSDQIGAISKSGGTIDGTAVFTFADSGNWGSGADVTYPVKRGGFTWLGQSDGVYLFAEETGKDNLNLVLQFTDDNSNVLSIRNAAGNQVAYISANGTFSGTFSGNASSATKATNDGNGANIANTYLKKNDAITNAKIDTICV